MKRFLPVLALGALVAACVPPATPPAPGGRTPLPQPASPRPRPAPAPAAQDWRDRPYTPGDWVYRQDARGSLALFGPPNRDALLTLRCDRQRGQMFLSRPGAAPAALVIRTTSLTRTLQAAPTGGEPPYVAAALLPRDPLLDAMAFSRGRIVVEVAGAAPLVVPNWAEIGRVVEDCRG
ncbi:hypothetical protein [Sphingomonas aracearum]|uniref:Lipoprotein n=1 Tax=Sphingomonas aracearum TaxID=2283317 RepID=A0A369VZS4_9SPHN|nr:hypothetical protein [Sphingomonas aracearum]RDE07125.1 hypothetical protein DVW87_05600 [Sphingomonas aracearum]